MLFTHPRAWARSAVGSWGRFAFMALATAGFTVLAVYLAAEDGLRTGLAVALFPVLLQLQLLYALRRLVRQASGLDVTSERPTA